MKKLILFLFISHYSLFIINCLSAQQISNSENTIATKLNDITIDTIQKSIAFPAKIKLTKELIEVVLCTNRGKAYESLLVTDITPLELQTALIMLGLKCFNDSPITNEEKNDLNLIDKRRKRADSVKVYIQGKDSTGLFTRQIEDFIYDVRNNKTMKPSSWFFYGFNFNKDGKYIINESSSLIASWNDFNEILQLNNYIGETLKNRHYYHAYVNNGLKIGADVNVIIKPYFN